MKRLLSLLRLRALLAGGVVVLLAGTGLLALRSAGPAAAAGGGHVSMSSRAVASASPRPATAAAASTTSLPRGVGHGGTGLPAAAPTSRGLSETLRQATGLSPSQVTVRQLCPAAAPGRARCAGEALVLRSSGAPVHPRITARGSLRRVSPALRRGVPAGGGAPASSAAPPGGYTPAYLQQAYDLLSLSQNAGTGDTVAIVDAYDDPAAESDLGNYRSFFGLRPCTTANGCFRKVNQSGGGTPPAYSDPGWNQEISLDLDAVSAICPNCNILLVEADSPDLSDLDTAMQTAHTLGADQISDSWTATASSVPSGTYTFPGVATVAATGDAGYVLPFQNGHPQDNYPAALPGVTAAGGTTLAPAGGGPNPRGFGEGAWVGAGSGCDRNQAIQKPAYQSDTGCSGRSYADLSADADPDTGLAVYENGGWSLVGGTSLATPMIAAYYAITGGANSTPQWAYGNSGALNDIVSGSNGTCATAISYICTAGPGYDGPTGVGSISGDAVATAPGIGGPAIATASGANTYTESTRSDGATITGGIYPNRLDTTWWIQYWPASGGTVHQTPAADIGAGTAPVTVTGYPSHLASNSQYDYRLVATNSAGTIYGYTFSFTTPAASATAPVAAFTSSPAPSTPGSAVDFDASGSTDSGAAITDYSWDFGDGSRQDTGSTPTTSHTYSSPGEYGVTLIVTNSDGESETSTQTLTVDTAPSASFTASSSQPSPGAQLSLDATGSSDAVGTITDYSWDFGDASRQDTGSTPTTSHTYAVRGSYTITLTVTNDAGQADTTTRTVTVDDPPSATLTPSTTLTTPGSTVSFSSNASSPDTGGRITAYSWNFGDPSSAQNTATLANPTHTYAAPGIYPVTLTVTDDLAVSTTKTAHVTIDAPPTAAFTASSSQPSPGAQLSLDATGSSDAVGTITDYSWDFGDPGSPDDTATGPTPTHTYAVRGSYTITLTVTNDAGQTNSSTQTVTVDDAPTLSLSPATAITAPNLLVSFNATASSPDPGGSIARYSWNFGDPTSTHNTSTHASAGHAYASPGTYRVTVTVTDDLGVSSTKTGHVTVDAAPSASFTASSSQPSPGAQLSLDATGSSDAVGTITDYSWDFGDASRQDTGSTPTTSHTYAVRGSYTITLTVTNDAGQADTTTRTVTVDDPPSATLTPSTTLTTPGSTVSFSSNASSPDTGGTITAYSWNFGDPSSAQNTATLANPTHTYAAPGIYPVTLTVTDDLAVSTTKTAHVTIDAPPTAAFTISPNPGTAGSAVGFDASGSGDSVGTITDYSWDFGDPGSPDDTAASRAPSHLYGSPGTYTVSLTVTNDAGQAATSTANVTVNSVATAGQQSTSGPAPGPTSASTPTPAGTPVGASTVAPTPLTASLGAAKRQKLAAVLAHGLGVRLAVSQGTTARFQVMLPVGQSRLAGRKAKTRAIVLLRTRAQTLGAGTHAITLKLSPAAARELAGTGPLVLTVRATLTTTAGGTVIRSVKITLTR